MSSLFTAQALATAAVVIAVGITLYCISSIFALPERWRARRMRHQRVREAFLKHLEEDEMLEREIDSSAAGYATLREAKRIVAEYVHERYPHLS